MFVDYKTKDLNRSYISCKCSSKYRLKYYNFVLVWLPIHELYSTQLSYREQKVLLKFITNGYHLAYLCIDLLKSIPSYSDSTAHVFDSICDNPCLQFSTAVFSLLIALLFFEISSLYFLQILFGTITSQLRNLLEILNHCEPKIFLLSYVAQPPKNLFKISNRSTSMLQLYC